MFIVSRNAINDMQFLKTLGICSFCQDFRTHIYTYTHIVHVFIYGFYTKLSKANGLVFGHRTKTRLTGSIWIVNSFLLHQWINLKSLHSFPFEPRVSNIKTKHVTYKRQDVMSYFPFIY